jgi:hypothetical protein
LPKKGVVMTGVARVTLPVLALGLAAAVLSGCGGSAHASPGASAAARGGDACDQVADVLGSGPNSVTDPVGYARAHVRPLRQIHATDAKVQEAIDQLADAYAAYSASNGGHAAKLAVAKAGAALTLLCPHDEDQ